MIKNWKIHRPGQAGSRWTIPQATMNKRGDIKLTRSAWELLDCPEYANLLYDEHNKLIGIQPQRAHTSDAFRLVAHHEGGGRSLTATGLRPRLALNTDKTISFANVGLDEDGILILDLKMARPLNHGLRRSGIARNYPAIRNAHRRSVLGDFAGSSEN